MTPKLTIKDLTLVPFTAEMVEPWHVAWLNDPEVVKFSEQRHRTHTIESQQRYLNEMPSGGHIWLIQHGCRDRGVIVGAQDLGTVTAYRDEMNRTANIGVLVCPDNWGEGIGHLAFNAIIDWCRNTGIEKVECGCRWDNVAMRGLAIKCGLNIEGRIPRHFRDDSGKRVDMGLYGVRL